MVKDKEKQSKIKLKIMKHGVIIVVVIALLCIIAMAHTNYHKIKTITTDVSNYLKFEDPLYSHVDSFEKLAIFPENLKEDYNVNSYFYADVFQRHRRLGQHFYIDITYNVEDYEQEIERLQKWERLYSVDGVQKSANLLYDQEHFDYPAYVASYDWLKVYEYALILSDTRILYVYIKSTIEDSLSKNPVSPLEPKYLPQRYYEKKFLETDFTFCVYLNS